MSPREGPRDDLPEGARRNVGSIHLLVTLSALAVALLALLVVLVLNINPRWH